MDIKGAYLNGILQETVYMKQPEGYEDGTGRVCKLIKTLYGLKQSGREWNKQLDEKLRLHGYKCLISDPCTYVRWDGDNVTIITVWVDNLLLFASSDEMMEHMKSSIESEWQATDLGEPSKIIGIEITRMPEYLRISQGKYINNLLRKEKMAEANPVGMPLDPNVKIGPNPEHNEPNRSNSYAKLLGELQYVANATHSVNVHANSVLLILYIGTFGTCQQMSADSTRSVSANGAESVWAGLTFKSCGLSALAKGCPY